MRQQRNYFHRKATKKTADELTNDPNYQGMKRNVDAFVFELICFIINWQV